MKKSRLMRESKQAMAALQPPLSSWHVGPHRLLHLDRLAPFTTRQALPAWTSRPPHLFVDDSHSEDTLSNASDTEHPDDRVCDEIDNHFLPLPCSATSIEWYHRPSGKIHNGRKGNSTKTACGKKLSWNYVEAVPDDDHSIICTKCVRHDQECNTESSDEDLPPSFISCRNATYSAGSTMA